MPEPPQTEAAPAGPRPETMTAGLGRQIRHLAWLALALVGLVFGGLLLFAHSQKIAGAVLAAGSVVTESEARLIQHHEGGIVRRIHVKNGARVRRGDPLVELDTHIVRASLTSVLRQLEEGYASQARLLAERDGRPTLSRPAAGPLPRATGQLAAHDAARLDRIYAGQQRLMDARLKALRGTRQRLDRQIGHIRRQIEGIGQQVEAKQTELALLDAQIESEAALAEENYLAQHRLMASRRLRARLAGELGELMSQRASAGERISQREIQKLRLVEDYWAGVLRELQQVRSDIAQLEQQRIQAQDILTRTLIRAPGDGVVHNLGVHTQGGVVRPAEVIMALVPADDSLVIDARLLPVDIDRVAPEQAARVRFPGLDQKHTPELAARVVSVSPDLLQDELTGMPYYNARLRLASDELQRLNGKTLLPGMPVDVMIQTERRSILSYFVKPVTDQMTFALRER